MVAWNFPQKIRRLLQIAVAAVGTVLAIVLLVTGLPKGWPLAFPSVAWALAALSITGVMLYLLSGRKAQLDKLFLIFGGVIGLIFLFALTPLSAPDEYAHYNITSDFSDKLFFGGARVGVAQESDFDGYTAHLNTMAGYEKLFTDLFAPFQPVERGEVHSGKFSIGHLPAVLLMAPVRALGGNGVQCLYAGRLGCLLFYILITALAIRLTPRYKFALFLTAMMPMCLHQAASLSYDAYLNAMAFLTFALIIRAIVYEDKHHEFLWASLSLLFLAPTKLIYAIALLPMLLLIPAKNGWVRALRFVLTAAVVAFAGIVPNLGTIAVVSDVETSYYTLSDVLHDPFGTLGLMVNTMIVDHRMYLMGCVGQYMSGLSIILRERYVKVYLIALFLSLVCENATSECKTYSLIDRWPYRAMSCVSVLGMIGAVMLTMMLAWTEAGATVISGIQGRYFIPAVPFVVSLLNYSGFHHPEGCLGTYMARYGMIVATIVCALVLYSDFNTCVQLMYATFAL